MNRLLHWVGYAKADDVPVKEDVQTQGLTRPFSYRSLSDVNLADLTETVAEKVLSTRTRSFPDLLVDPREPAPCSNNDSPFSDLAETPPEMTDAELAKAKLSKSRVPFLTRRIQPAIASELPSKSFSVGEFKISWQNGPTGAGLRIRNNLVPECDFSTPLGSAFIRSGFYAFTVDGTHSSFSINHQKEAMSKQTVDSIESDGHCLKIQGIVKTLDGTEHEYELTLQPEDARNLDFKLQIKGDKKCFSELVFTRDGETPLTGFGEQFTHMDMNGKLVPMLTEEGGVGRGQWPISPLVGLVVPGAQGSPMSTYFPMSVGHNGRGTWIVDNTEYHEYDARTPGQLKILSFSPELRGHLIAAAKPPERVDAIGDVLGRLPKLPDWSQHGAIVGIQGGREVVMKRLASLQKSNVPISALWIQDWIGQRRTNYCLQLWWNYELDPDHYPDILEMRAALKAQNIRLLGYVNPMIVDITDKEKCTRNFFEEGKKNGYFVKNKEGEPYPIHVTIYGHLVDLTNPEARAWYKDIIKSSFLKAGLDGDLIFDGGMMDFGEGLPFDAVLHDGTPGEVYHNQYPVEWARLVNEVRKELGQDELLFFHRSGFTGSPEVVSTVWAGDQNHTYDRYDGLHSALIGMLTAGMSGLSHSHSDIGGYTTLARRGIGYKRPEHLQRAWMEFSAFTSLFRSHEGSEPDQNVQVYTNERTRSLFGRCARIFAGLAKYRSRLFVAANLRSQPVNPALGFYYPDDKRSEKCDNEFMLGPDVLMAPTLSHWQGLVGRNVYLPPGKWVHMWTGEVYGSDDDPADPGAQGEDHWFRSAPGQPTAFVRKGSALEKELPKEFGRWGIGCFGAPDSEWPPTDANLNPYMFGNGLYPQVDQSERLVNMTTDAFGNQPLN